MSRIPRSPSGYRALAVSLAVVAGLGIGALAASAAIGDVSHTPPAPSGAATTAWPTNAEGLTYGSAALAGSPQDEPDLIEAEATNGKIGYVLRSDLEGPEPATPQEALQQQAAFAERDQLIPVYKSDGITAIGVFVVTHDPDAGVVPTE